jgi:hypothetical protein
LAPQNRQDCGALLTEVERPYVFVFGVEWEPIAQADPLPPSYIAYKIANYGKTPGVVDVVETILVISDAIPAHLNQEESAFPLVSSPILPYGEIRRVTRPYFDRPVASFVIRDDGLHPVPRIDEGESVFFRISIKYHGPFTRNHEIGYCWRYETTTQSFAQHGGAEYNYLK